MTAVDSTPKIAFCITCRGRTSHLRLTLPANLRDNASYPNAVFIVLNYGSPDDLLAYLLTEHIKAIDSGRLIVETLENAGKFRMAHAKNFCHRLGIREGCSILVNIDADNYTGPGFAAYIAEQFREPNIYLWSRMVQRCNADCDGGTCLLPRDHVHNHSADPVVLADLYPESDRPRNRGISGRIAVTANAFLKSGGYNERYVTWGPDDRDFNQRLVLLGYQGREIDARYLYAVHHSEKLRFREYPGARPLGDSQEQPVEVDPHTAVVNFGRFGCGVSVDVIGGHVELLAVPTRIFGIGLGKTGTTSLCEALNILGLDCVHWPSPRWARRVWTEMAEFGKSITLERHYSATDLPIGVLYEQLDTAYLGSKFILTTRNEDRWVESARRHWSYEHNRWRASWDSDCWSHQMHRYVFGRKTFDATVFLDRFRRHNADVLAYFRNRPHDLLVMDLDDDAGWFPLCTFLGKPIPAVPYPKAFVTAQTLP